jgi:hypothetical protein
MNNMELREWVDRKIKYQEMLYMSRLDDGRKVQEDIEALAQLRAMLEERDEPTEEKRRKLVAHLEEAWDLNSRGNRYFQDSFHKIRALILTAPPPKPMVRRARNG